MQKGKGKDAVAADSSGYSKEEYYKISLKHGLPQRCPILGKCCRAIRTRFEVGHQLGGSDMKFDEFLRSQGQSWDLEKMVNEVELISWSYAFDVLTSVENVCPEVTLFEPEYLPFNFIHSAFGRATYYKDTRRFSAEPKHYSECAEFSEYIFHNSELKIKGLKTNDSAKMSEKKLESYLAGNLELLESGLTLVAQQKPIGKWAVDMYASDAAGNDVIIELKAKKLNLTDIHALTGQALKYFNSLKKKANNLRLIVVIPVSGRDKVDALRQGLHQCIERVSLYYFDYLMYEEQFVFTKHNWTDIDSAN